LYDGPAKKEVNAVFSSSLHLFLCQFQFLALIIGHFSLSFLSHVMTALLRRAGQERHDKANEVVQVGEFII